MMEARDWELLALSRMDCEEIEAQLDEEETIKYREAMKILTGV